MAMGTLPVNRDWVLCMSTPVHTGASGRGSVGRVMCPTWPTARAAADPPDEPPAVLRMSQGFSVVAKTLKVWEPAPNSGVLVFPA